MGEKFIGNLGTKRVHSATYADGRCKLDKIKEENRIEFESLEAGLNYPSAERRILAPCGICIPKYNKFRVSKSEQKN